MRVAAVRWWGICLGLAVAVDAGAQVRGAIVAAGIELHAMQISAMWTENAHAIGRALDGTMDARVEMARDREEARAVIAHTPAVGVCEGIEGFRGVSAARGIEAAAAEDAGDALRAWLVADADELAGWTPPGELRERFDEVHARFCAEDRVHGGGGGCTGPDEAHAADVHPGAVLGVTTFEDGEALIAGIEWARNVAMPVPSLVMSPREARNTLERRRLLADRARAARAALATGYLQGRVSARVPAVTAGPWAEVVGPGVVEAGPGGEMSAQGLLEALSRGRYERPGFFARLQGEPRANLLRELIVEEATALVAGFEGYRQAEWRGAMTAARLARAVERDRRL